MSGSCPRRFESSPCIGYNHPPWNAKANGEIPVNSVRAASGLGGSPLICAVATTLSSWKMSRPACVVDATIVIVTPLWWRSWNMFSLSGPSHAVGSRFRS